MKFNRLILSLIIIAVLSLNTQARKLQVPVSIQAPMLEKILQTNPKLKDKEKLTILIVYDNSSRIAKDEFIEAYEDKRINIIAIQHTGLENTIEKADAVYFMPGLQTHSKICKEYKVLSIAGNSKYVEKGDISIAIGLLNNKPKLYVNMESLKQENSSISVFLLKIAKVYG